MIKYEKIPISTKHAPIAGLTTAETGDTGPSGFKGAAKRNKLLSELNIKPVLSVSQIHSLSILVMKSREVGNESREKASEKSQEKSLEKSVTSSSTYDCQYYLIHGQWIDEKISVERSKVLFRSFESEEDLLDFVGQTEVDGIITDLQVGVGITVADCGPLLLYYSDVKVALHSGWKGTGILGIALQELIENWNVPANDITAYLGPCISLESYEVDKPRYDLFTTRFGSNCGIQRINDDGSRKYFIDIKEANKNIAAKWKINLKVDPRCTFQDSGLYSYRKQSNPQFKRMLAFIGYNR